MIISLFGIYDKHYSRNRVIINGWLENGVKVMEICERQGGFFKYFKLGWQLFKKRSSFDYLWVAFPGQVCVILAKLLTRKKIIFDCFTSHYQGLVEDRKVIRRNSVKAKINFWLDKFSCRLADLVILDTNEHIKYFVETFQLPKDKFIRLFVGSDDNVYYPREKSSSDKFLVHWHGHYIPLQGAEIIIEAANILKDNKEIEFKMIGRGQQYQKCRQLADKHHLKNINFMDNISYEQLAEQLAEANLSLGIFSLSQKASLVIPNKIYEALASARALITEESPAAKELLTNGENVLFCRAGSSDDLASKILELKKDQELRDKIAKAGYQLFDGQLRPKKLIRELITKINVYFNPAISK